MRQLLKIGRHGLGKIKQIKRYWLEKDSPVEVINFSLAKYLMFDGTYFRHQNCLVVLMDTKKNQVIANSYCDRENYHSSLRLFTGLKSSGLDPKAITIDGNPSVIRALKQVWPNTVLQRCLAHIQRQGLSWLRRYPKLESAKQLRYILLKVTGIVNDQQKLLFLSLFKNWEKEFGKQVCALPSTDKVYSDLQRTRSLLIHALPDMFYYLTDRSIASTTNRLEGYFSQLKQSYRRHNGLSKEHRKNYLTWYVYFKNQR